MSEQDIFAALRLGVRFDTKRFEKDINQFTQPKVADPLAVNEGNFVYFLNLTIFLHRLYQNLRF